MTQTFIRLEDGRELNFPRAGKTVTIQNVEQLRKAFDGTGEPILDGNGDFTYETFYGPVKFQERDLFKAQTKADLNILDGVRHGYDEKYYNKTGETESSVGGVIHITPTTEQKGTPTQLANKLRNKVKNDGYQRYNNAKVYYDAVNDSNSPVYDAADAYITEFETWRGLMQTQFTTFKSEVQAILAGPETDAEKYDLIIAWYATYSADWPEAPEVPE